MRMKNPVHPGEIIREEYLIPLGLSITEAAEKIGVTRKALSELVNERAGVTPLMAWRLSIAFDTSPELWTTMQAGYDLARERENPALTSVKRIYTSAPMMVREPDHRQG